MSLAERLGKTVRQLRRELGDGELLYWQAKLWIESNGPDAPIESVSPDEEIPLDDRLNSLFESFARRAENLGLKDA